MQPRALTIRLVGKNGAESTHHVYGSIVLHPVFEAHSKTMGVKLESLRFSFKGRHIPVRSSTTYYLSAAEACTADSLNLEDNDRIDVVEIQVLTAITVVLQSVASTNCHYCSLLSLM